MKKLKSYEIRDMWVKFWENKEHEIIGSASLIPHNDPSLLWINAGIAPLKKFFDGREIPNNRKMANVQKCIRTNDIENVGKTARHHTFFEMLGNFSIGDYFRDEALTYAFELLTSKEYFNFDLDKLYFTVYPNDEESVQKWLELGVEADHIIKVEGNFWEIGEGPCGPDTEIFYDRGPAYDPENIGTRLISEEIENERYIEIWNIVFSQYNAISGLSRDEYPELPNKNIDTGMGLERVACIMQSVETNYETDLFVPIIDEISKLTQTNYNGQMSFKVISDHLRSVVFALSDGASFSNEGRGYVLRRLVRRAMRYGHDLGMDEAFLYKLVNIVVKAMESFYPELKTQEDLITKQIKTEEERFLKTLSSGKRRLLDFINDAEDKIITGEFAFLLYDTFGFPFELTKELASEHNFTVNEAEFKKLLEAQKERARAAREDDDSMGTQHQDMLEFTKNSEFIGYTNLHTNSKVIGIFVEGRAVQEATGTIIAVFDKTGFYAESGGQIGDIGLLNKDNKTYPVINTIKLPNEQHGLVIKMNEDILRIGDIVKLSVDKTFRNDVAKNHSVTHLLNESLRIVLGDHVHQQGSQVYNDGLRFDFNHFSNLTDEEIIKIEKLVNDEIQKNHQVKIKHMTLDEAKKLGAEAMFGEKYGDEVRVIDMDFCIELCGGTHVANTKDIERFAILSVESKGSGVYRIEAVSGKFVEEKLDEVLKNINKEIIETKEKIEDLVKNAKDKGVILSIPSLEISGKLPSYQMIVNRHQELDELRNVLRTNTKELETKLLEKLSIPLDQYLDNKIAINGNNIIVFKIFDKGVNLVKDLIDRLADKLDNSVVLGASVNAEKIVFVCKNKIKNLNAGSLVKKAAIITGGNGGGRPDFAQAGGRDVSKVDEALEAVLEEIKAKL